MTNIRSVAIGIRNINTKSGLGKILLEQVNYYLSQGIDVTIYTSKYDDTIKASEVKIVKIPRIPLVGEYYQRLLFAKQAEKKIQKGAHNLVIGHGDLLNQDVMFLHNLVEKAYLLTHQKPMQPLNPIAKIRRLILNQQGFKALVANSKLMKDELENVFHIPTDKISVIYPAFDPQQFNTKDAEAIRTEMRQALNISQETLLIGFITSGDFKKRALDLFIEALHKLDSKIDYKVLLVGKDKNLPLFMDLAKKYDLEERFIIREPVAEVESYFHAVDFTVHPAHFEEFGMVVQEAMACGLPVITSQRVGASEVMLDQSTVMPTPDVDVLTQQIQRLLEKPQLRQELSQKALQSVEGRGWNSYIASFVKLTEKI